MTKAKDDLFTESFSAQILPEHLKELGFWSEKLGYSKNQLLFVALDKLFNDLSGNRQPPIELNDSMEFSIPSEDKGVEETSFGKPRIDNW